MNPADFEHAHFDPREFSGTVRMFPIPNLVLFPHVVQPLHIFEERYREMMSDALVGDRLIAMPVLKSGWEPEYAGRPPIEPWACLGKVVLHNKLPDGCYNLLLMGVARLKIESELDPLRSFRQAKASIISDVASDQDDEYQELRQQVVEVFDAQVDSGKAPCSLKPLLENDLPLAQLTDLVAYALPLDVEQKLALLAEPCAVSRARLLLSFLPDDLPRRKKSAVAAGFPPNFSMN